MTEHERHTSLIGAAGLLLVLAAMPLLAGERETGERASAGPPDVRSRTVGVAFALGEDEALARPIRPGWLRSRESLDVRFDNGARLVLDAHTDVLLRERPDGRLELRVARGIVRLPADGGRELTAGANSMFTLPVALPDARPAAGEPEEPERDEWAVPRARHAQGTGSNPD